MTNKKLKNELLDKLGITPQALYLRAKKIKKQNPVTTEDAIYIIAQKENIILDKYLDANKIDKIREILQIDSPLSQSKTLLKSTQKSKNLNETKNIIIQIAKEFKITDPILSRGKILEAKEMAKIYPLLYVLENSIRDLINKIMTSKYDDNWWIKKAPRGLQGKVTVRMNDEKRNSWHQKRGARPIDYLDLNQLSSLMRNIEEDVVPDIIPSLNWFDQLIDEVYKSRCVVCHMNPLDKDNIVSVKLRFRQWQRHIKEKKNLILNNKNL